MSQIENNMSDKQVKIYLAVLGVLLVVAVVVTVFTTYREQQLAQEESNQQTAEESGGMRAVQRNFLDANSKIEETSDVPEKPNRPAEEPSQMSQAADAQLEDEEEEVAEEEPWIEPEPAAFDPDADVMIWPVSGNVVMDYSPDALIYDATLDLYRTNNSISIGASESEDVLAAADGVVQEVGYSDEMGHFVVLENGNGYETTYGQLSEEALVEVGQAVAGGEVIGQVSAPSWYSAALGTHLTFTVEVNGEPVNPLDVLANTLDE